MYIQDKWIIKDSIEYEIKYYGKYGAKGEKRAKRKKATPEIIKKQNQKNRIKRMKRTIKANFDEGDLWITIKYPKGTRKEVSEVKKDLRKFCDSMRRKHKAHNSEFKFVYRMEVGKQGGIHIHMITNRIRGEDTAEHLQKSWKHGRINYQALDDGQYEDLAAYIVKEPDEEVYKQLSLFPMQERKEFIKYSASRNLVRPTPERKVFRKKTLRKMLNEGIEASNGYYVIKDSIRMGKNPYTGMSYIHYTERKVRAADG